MYEVRCIKYDYDIEVPLTVKLAGLFCWRMFQEESFYWAIKLLVILLRIKYRQQKKLPFIVALILPLLGVIKIELFEEINYFRLNYTQ